MIRIKKRRDRKVWPLHPLRGLGSIILGQGIGSPRMSAIAFRTMLRESVKKSGVKPPAFEIAETIF